MSVQSEIDRIKDTLGLAYLAITDKDGEIPSEMSIENLPPAIASIPSGISTSDATATAQQIAEGYSAYANGEKVEGSMVRIGSEDASAICRYTSCTKGFETYNDEKIFYMRVLPNASSNYYFVAGKSIQLSTPASSLGTATRVDVRSGVTFTSADGIQQTGTATFPDAVNVTFSLGNFSSSQQLEIHYLSSDLSFTRRVLSGNTSETYQILKKSHIIIHVNAGFRISVSEADPYVTLVQSNSAMSALNSGGSSVLITSKALSMLILNGSSDVKITINPT